MKETRVILAAALAALVAGTACEPKYGDTNEGASGIPGDANSSTGRTVNEAPVTGTMSDTSSAARVSSPTDSLNMGRTGTTGVTGTTPETSGGAMGAPQTPPRY